MRRPSRHRVLPLLILLGFPLQALEPLPLLPLLDALGVLGGGEEDVVGERVVAGVIVRSGSTHVIVFSAVISVLVLRAVRLAG
jgi:hypothetical protein